MATTNFVDGLTVVVADWLNDVDEHVYQQDTTAHQAAHITVTPAGGITSTDVQAALVELDSDLVAGLASGLATKANLSGATFSGAVNVPAGASGTQVPQAQEVVLKADGAAKVATWTTGTRPGTPSAGDIGFKSNFGMFEGYTGDSWKLLNRKALTRFVTTSGTSYSWTGLPEIATSFVMSLEQVSNTGGNNYLIRMGPVAGVLTTGYYSFAHLITSGGTSTVTSGVISGITLMPNSSGSALTGTVVFDLVDATDNKWMVTSVLTTAGGSTRTEGYVSLGAGTPLSVIEILRTSTDTFDNGAVQLTVGG